MILALALGRLEVEEDLVESDGPGRGWVCGWVGGPKKPAACALKSLSTSTCAKFMVKTFQKQNHTTNVGRIFVF